jgi:aldehyde reductase
LIKFCKERDIVVTAYSPLGSPDRPWAQPDEPKLLEDPKLLDISKHHGKSPAQVLLRWCIQRGVQAIPKSVTFSRIQENFNIFDFHLSEEEINHISSFECNGRVVVPKINGKFRDAAHPHFPFNIEF